MPPLPQRPSGAGPTTFDKRNRPSSILELLSGGRQPSWRPPHRRQGRSLLIMVVSQVKMGAIMGGTVGAIMGFIFGSYTIIRHGAGSNGMGRTIGQYMLTSGTTFGFFMAIGSVIRTDSPDVQFTKTGRWRRVILMPEANLLATDPPWRR